MAYARSLRLLSPGRLASASGSRSESRLTPSSVPLSNASGFCPNFLWRQPQPTRVGLLRASCKPQCECRRRRCRRSPRGRSPWPGGTARGDSQAELRLRRAAETEERPYKQTTDHPCGEIPPAGEPQWCRQIGLAIEAHHPLRHCTRSRHVQCQNISPGKRISTRNGTRP